MTVTLAGSGPEGYVEHLKSRASSTQLAGAVTFTGLLDRAAVGRLLASSHLFVLPSLWSEPFGLATLEALAHGLPAVVSSAGGSPEIVRDGLDGLVVPSGDAAALAEALVRLERDEVARMRLARAGLERVGERLRGRAHTTTPCPRGSSEPCARRAVEDPARRQRVPAARPLRHGVLRRRTGARVDRARPRRRRVLPRRAGPGDRSRGARSGESRCRAGRGARAASGLARARARLARPVRRDELRAPCSRTSAPTSCTSSSWPGDCRSSCHGSPVPLTSARC
ncbi:Spore coat protein SA [Planctomycetes bacterium Pla163]|uniref:Spore coat protein SA n=1 Tax=Rohdeia mirabilis TaxID=2528008 RepID=A0A518CYP2_9BACT|nr:Spore coat protein SA [Planctomycetes bacterium Pla163]